MSHTLGPWEMEYKPVEDRYVLRNTEGNFGHFQGWASDGVTTEEEDAANAHLIKAAPDLLEAAKTLVAECESMGRASHRNATIDAMKAAIARAAGQVTP